MHFEKWLKTGAKTSLQELTEDEKDTAVMTFCDDDKQSNVFAAINVFKLQVYSIL